jgi:5'-3' exonuclease
MQIKKSIHEIELFLHYIHNNNSTDISINDIQYLNDYINTLKQQIWKPTSEYIKQTQKILHDKGCCIITAPFEADTYIAEMFSNKEIDYIVSNDSDLVVLGCTHIIRPRNNIINIINNKKDSFHRQVYIIPTIIQKLGHTDDTWNTFIELCKCTTIKDIDKIGSISRVYKNKHYIMKKFPSLFIQTV